MHDCYGYIYKITCLYKDSSLFEHFYIGQHKLGEIDLHKNYICSGNRIRHFLRKHFNIKSTYTVRSLSDFSLRKEILCKCYSADELNKKEIEYISLSKNNTKCLNLSKGGDGVLDLPPEIEEKRLMNLKKARSSIESRNKTSNSLKELWKDDNYKERHAYNNFSLEKQEEIRTKKIAWSSKAENKKLISDKTKAAMQRKDVKEKILKVSSSEEHRLKHSLSSKKLYENNDLLKKQISEKVTASWKNLTPEEYKKRCEAIKSGMRRKKKNV